MASKCQFSYWRDLFGYSQRSVVNDMFANEETSIVVLSNFSLSIKGSSNDHSHCLVEFTSTFGNTWTGWSTRCWQEYLFSIDEYSSCSNICVLVVANQYKIDRRIFEKTARHWANVYANGRSSVFDVIQTSMFFIGPHAEPTCDAAIASLADMGFTEVRTRHSSMKINRAPILRYFQGKGSFSVINNALEYKRCFGKLM
jgi:hypothetical protein